MGILGFLFFLFAMAAGAFGIALIVAGFFERQHEADEVHMAGRINRVATTPLDKRGGVTQISEVDREFAKEEERRITARKTTYLPTLSKVAAGNDYLLSLENELLQVRSRWRATEVVAFSIFAALFTFVLLLFIAPKIFALLAIPILFLPRTYVKTLRASYFRKFDDQLADALLLMSNSLRAGFSFLQAMEMVAREAQAPLSEEFRRATQEIAVGVTINDALNGMADRVKSVDLGLVVTAVIIQREVGGALAQLLELIAAVIRERQRIKGEIRTLTAQGRLTGAILGAMPFTVGLLIYFVGRAVAPGEPSFIEPLLTETVGQMILAGAFIWEVIGFWLIMRIVSIKV